MFFEIEPRRIGYKRNGHMVFGEAVCLMDWPDADGTLQDQRYRLLVLPDERDPEWLDVPETRLFDEATRQRVFVWTLLQPDDQLDYFARYLKVSPDVVRSLRKQDLQKGGDRHAIR
ncbi:hypothetical protein G4Y79_05095 [Phototrophicus methaneseepsis]|uniref:Uncharacterized protein n=1 Tax=Phototrophicus methaneseepsis TaxID=2710758 RepID=A0A7S8EB82_9CHLR|nr:hypothetical protein [Phototrophicus methaneseepsis]QPC83756.1 hypothetical protein G4Y79_05095 [Phototrophicus methaneseepsis]